MFAIDPLPDYRQTIIARAAMVKLNFGTWASSKSHNTFVPKKCLDSLLECWYRFRKVDHFGTLQPLVPHFEDLLVCRQLFVTHVDTSGSWDEHAITEAGKQAIT